METKQMARVSRQYHKPMIERKMKVALYARLSVGIKNYCSADGNTPIENPYDESSKWKPANKSQAQIAGISRQS